MKFAALWKITFSTESVGKCHRHVFCSSIWEPNGWGWEGVWEPNGWGWDRRVSSSYWDLTLSSYWSYIEKSILPTGCSIWKSSSYWDFWHPFPTELTLKNDHLPWDFSTPYWDFGVIPTCTPTGWILKWNIKWNNLRDLSTARMSQEGHGIIEIMWLFS